MWAFLWVSLSIACSPARAPAPTPEASAVETAQPPEPAAPSATTSASPAPPPEPAPVTTVDRPPGCVGTGFDLDELFTNALPKGKKSAHGGKLAGTCQYKGPIELLIPLAGAEAIDVSIAVTPSPLPPGATGTVIATFTNKTEAPRSVLFVRACDDPLLVANAYGSEGDRADLEKSDFGCGVGRGCMTDYVVVTLEPKGTATASGSYAAKMMRLHEKQCEEKPVGPLKAGDYELRVWTPLQFLELPTARGGSMRVAATRLEVGKRK